MENSDKALACIRHNLIFTHLDQQAQVLSGDAVTAPVRLEQQGAEPFDVIFMDPPYDKEWEVKVLTQPVQTGPADEYTRIIVEASLSTDFSFAKELGLTIQKEKKYKTNKHVWLRRESI